MTIDFTESSTTRDESFNEMKQKVLDRFHKGPELVLKCTAQYPYDGCWYEPNFWLFKGGRFYPIYASGKIYKMLGVTSNTPWTSGVGGLIFLHKMEEEVGFGSARYNEWEVHEASEWTPDNFNLLNVASILFKGHGLEMPKWTCTICHKDCRGLAKFLGYKGNGGIGVYISDPCCFDCFAKIKYCGHCYSYVVPVYPGDEVDPNQEVLPEVEMERDYDKLEMKCPNCSQPDSNHYEEEQDLSDPTDEAAPFGLDGRKFLGPDGDVEGLDGISIMIMKKGG